MTPAIFSSAIQCNVEVVDSLRKYGADIANIHKSVEWEHYNSEAASQAGLIAKVADVVVGYLAFMRRSSGSLEINFIAVHSDHQERGIGYQLFARAVSYSQENGLSDLGLMCRVDKVGAFYRRCRDKLGLVLEERILGSYGNGDRSARFSFTIPQDVYISIKAV